MAFTRQPALPLTSVAPAMARRALPRNVVCALRGRRREGVVAVRWEARQAAVRCLRYARAEVARLQAAFERHRRWLEGVWCVA